MKRKSLLLIALGGVLLFSCDTGEVLSSSSFSALPMLSISENSSSSEEEVNQGPTYINPTAERFDKALHNTRISLLDSLSSKDIFSVKTSSDSMSKINYEGIVETQNASDSNIISSSNYSNLNIKNDLSTIEMNYDVKFASNNSIFSRDEDRSKLYSNEVNSSTNTSPTSHQKDVNSKTMFYYEDPTLYYDLPYQLNIGETSLDGKGKISNFSFNTLFGSAILNERDKIITMLSYEDVNQWPNETKQESYIDEGIILYEYMISDKRSDEEAVEALYNLEPLINEYLQEDISFKEEDKEIYIRLLKFIKSFSNEFVIFNEEDNKISINVRLDILIDFISRTCFSLIKNAAMFELSEEQLTQIQDIKALLDNLEIDKFKLNVIFLLNDKEEFSAIDYKYSFKVNNYEEILATYNETVDNTLTQYNEVFKGSYYIESNGTLSFEASDKILDITTPDLSTF